MNTKQVLLDAIERLPAQQQSDVLGYIFLKTLEDNTFSEEVRREIQLALGLDLDAVSPEDAKNQINQLYQQIINYIRDWVSLGSSVPRSNEISSGIPIQWAVIDASASEPNLEATPVDPENLRTDPLANFIGAVSHNSLAADIDQALYGE